MSNFTAQMFEDRLLNSLKQNGIPPRPAILERVISQTRQSEPNLRQLAETISADAAIAASLMKTVNSPFYGLPGKAHSVQQAISMLGLSATASAVASIALRRALPASPQLERFWDASMQIARLSGWLAQELAPNCTLTADIAYTFGLFRDCGIPILIRKLPDYYATLSKANNCPDRSFTQIEEEHHLTSHALVGYMLAQSWWLPPDITQAIRHHHDLHTITTSCPLLSEQSWTLAALAQLAEYVLQQISGQSQTREWEKMGAAIQARLGLDGGTLDSLVESARELPLAME